MIRKNLPVTTAKYLRRLTKIQHALQATRLDAAQSGNYACDNAAAPAQRSESGSHRLRARDKVGASVGAAKHQQPHQNQPHL